MSHPDSSWDGPGPCLIQFPTELGTKDTARKGILMNPAVWKPSRPGPRDASQARALG